MYNMLCHILQAILYKVYKIFSTEAKKNNAMSDSMVCRDKKFNMLHNCP